MDFQVKHIKKIAFDPSRYIVIICHFAFVGCKAKMEWACALPAVRRASVQEGITGMYRGGFRL